MLRSGIGLNELSAINRVVLVKHIEYRLTVPLLLGALWVVWFEFFNIAVSLVRVERFA